MKKSSAIALLTSICYGLHGIPAAAIDFDRSFTGSSSGQAEYFNSNRDKKMTISVSIISGVARPGVHQVPDNTNLLDALALAGGVTPDADLESVYVKRRNSKSKGGFETLEFDVAEIVREGEVQYPLLQNHDLVMIEAKPRMDQKLITVLTIVASTVGIVSGVILIRNASKD